MNVETKVNVEAKVNVETKVNVEKKEQLIHIVREWVRIDNELSTLSKEIAARKKEKKKLSVDLIGVMRDAEIDCFDLKDGQLMYTKTKTKKPITRKNLMGILSKYFSGNSEKAGELNEFIMENREEIVKETIVRKAYTST